LTDVDREARFAQWPRNGKSATAAAAAAALMLVALADDDEERSNANELESI